MPQSPSRFLSLTGATVPLYIFLVKTTQILAISLVSGILFAWASMQRPWRAVGSDGFHIDVGDMRGGVAQRKHLAKILTIRALEGALQRLREAR